MDSKTFSGYAAEYGTCIGVVWCVDFLLIAGGFTSQAGGIMLLGLLCMVLLPVLPCYFAHRLKRHVATGEGLSFGRAFVFCLLMMMYTCLLTAAVEYAYLRFVDKGQLLDTLTAIISAPEAQVAYRQLGMTDMLRQTEEVLDTLRQMKVSDIVVALMNQNIFIAIINSLIAACFGIKAAAPTPTEDTD